MVLRYRRRYFKIQPVNISSLTASYMTYFARKVIMNLTVEHAEK